MTLPDPAEMARHGLYDAVHVAETGIAHVWKVRRADGSDAALKIYNGRDPKGEDIGFELLHALEGHGTVRLFDYRNGIALMEWVEGPSLGDMSRDGHDTATNEALIKVADQIHTAPTNLPLRPLTEQFAALLQLDPRDTWSDQVRSSLKRGREIAKNKIENQIEIRCLHGDLHHDNILRGARGDLAIDAKGLIGDRGYELANAFQNPLNSTIVHDPTRARDMAERWAKHWQTPAKRLLAWAAAHSTISIVWADNFDDPDHTALLAMLLDLHDAA